jgi:hypothetical protein
LYPLSSQFKIAARALVTEAILNSRNRRKKEEIRLYISCLTTFFLEAVNILLTSHDLELIHTSKPNSGDRGKFLLWVTCTELKFEGPSKKKELRMDPGMDNK